MQRKDLVLLFSMVSTLGWGQQSLQWTIRETTAGKEPRVVTYQRSAESAEQTITVRRGERTQTTTVDALGATLRWKKTDASGRSLELARNGREFLLRSPEGTVRFPSDGLRWVQDLNQLTRFVLGTEHEVRFVAFADQLDARLKAADMTVFKATKVKNEPQTWGTGSGPTCRVRVTFDDWRSAFWGANYWFRLSDGQLVRYEEVRGGPGTPVTVGELVSEES